MRSEDDWDERQWLGGEAHVFVKRERSGIDVLRGWIQSDLGSLVTGAAAVGAALGSLGTASAMMAGRPKVGPIKKQRFEAQDERRQYMERTQEDERWVREDDGSTMGGAAVLAAFGLGLLAGALVTLLTTPETGESVRRRVRRGVDAAREELDEIMDEAKDSWSRVRDDAQEAVKRTTTKIKEAAKVTKEAVIEKPTQAPKA